MSSIKINRSDIITKVQDEIKKEFKLNPFDVPSIEQLVINVGVGKFSPGEKKEIEDLLEKLTGQKPLVVTAKKSIANFKLREGQTVGIKVTLRGAKAYDFLIQTIYLALPRTRDFRGVQNKGFDKRNKSYSFGINNAGIYPIIDKTAKFVFGLEINIVFNKPTEHNKTFLQKLNFPFKK